MALSLQQVLRQTQKLIMTPQMQQSIQLLQLNSLELEQMIHQEMMENPFLELVDDEENLRAENPDDSPADADREDFAEAPDSGLSEQSNSAEMVLAQDEPDRAEYSAEAVLGEAEPGTDNTPADQAPGSGEEPVEKFEQSDRDWDSEYSESDTSSYASTREDTEDHDFTTYTAIGESLYDSLLRQLRLSVLEGREVEIGEFIIGNLESSGFLDCSLDNQAKILGYPPDLIDIKGGKDSDNRLRRFIRKMRAVPETTPVEELTRRQLTALIVAHLLERQAEEIMSMPRKEWLRGLIARKLGRPWEEILETPETDLVLDTIAHRLRTTPEQIFDVLDVIHDFEPTGVGARNLAECLRLQCEEKGIRNPLLYRILEEHLSDLQQKRFREIAKALECPEAKVAEVFHIISHLDPKPGQSRTKDTPRFIVPDVYVKKVDDQYMYFLNEGDVGRLRVASSYRRMLQHDRRRGRAAAEAAAEAGKQPASANGQSAEDTSYAHEKYKNAVWLIKNIEKRKSTVLRVTEAIMNYQKEFLEKGIEHLRPLTLRNIAEVVGMHESTIARVTTHKYVETPRGIFELKYFFSSGLETDTGEDASSRSIKEMLTQMIAQEDIRKPLSDQKIADMLKDKGINIARRTVAKYREQLKILPAKLRKQVN